MPYYETVFIARQDLSEAQVKELTDAMSKILTDGGAKIHKTENWGLRTLAYKINKNRKGHYVLLECEAPGSAVIELERNLRLNEDVMHSLTTRLDALSKGPSPILDKDRGERDRKDRDFKEPREFKDKKFSKEAA